MLLRSKFYGSIKWEGDATVGKFAQKKTVIKMKSYSKGPSERTLCYAHDSNIDFYLTSFIEEDVPSLDNTPLVSLMASKD